LNAPVSLPLNQLQGEALPAQMPNGGAVTDPSPGSAWTDATAQLEFDAAIANIADGFAKLRLAGVIS